MTISPPMTVCDLCLVTDCMLVHVLCSFHQEETMNMTMVYEVLLLKLVALYIIFLSRRDKSHENTCGSRDFLLE